MTVKRGNLLPHGSIVYFTNNMEYGVIVKCAAIETLRYNQIYFVCDDGDGLWATHSVRNLWEASPELHPHCSLFQLLYKKLKI